MIRRTSSITDTTPMVLRTGPDDRRGRVQGAWAEHMDEVVHLASFRRHVMNARMPAIPRTTRCPRGLAATSSGLGHHMTTKEHGHDDHKPKRNHPWTKRNSPRDGRTSRQASSTSYLAQGPAAGPGSKAVVSRLRDSSAGSRRLGTSRTRQHRQIVGVSSNERRGVLAAATTHAGTDLYGPGSACLRSPSAGYKTSAVNPSSWPIGGRNSKRSRKSKLGMRAEKYRIKASTIRVLVARWPVNDVTFPRVERTRPSSAATSRMCSGTAWGLSRLIWSIRS
jgi:hypothetical protein